MCVSYVYRRYLMKFDHISPTLQRSLGKSKDRRSYQVKNKTSRRYLSFDAIPTLKLLILATAYPS